MAIVKRTLLGLGLMLAASTAVAADGALEINAACVANGCFAGDDPGFPVELNQAGGSYILTSNLQVPDAGTTAIRSLSTNVTIDLNGFTVLGPTVCTGEPVTSCSPTGTGDGIILSYANRLLNGYVSGFGDVGVFGATNSFVKDVTVTSNGGRGMDGRRFTVVDSVASYNGGTGFFFGRASGWGDLHRSQAIGNGDDGVAIGGGVVKDSRITDNVGVGIQGVGGGDFGYAGNFIDRNNSDGNQVAAGIAIGCNVVQGVADCPP